MTQRNTSRKITTQCHTHVTSNYRQISHSVVNCRTPAANRCRLFNSLWYLIYRYTLFPVYLTSTS